MTILRLYETAALGVEKDLTELHSRTGVKDKIATFWTDKLLAMAKLEQQKLLFDPGTRDRRLANKKISGPPRELIKDEIKADIQKELLRWVVQQPEHECDALFADTGTFWLERDASLF